MSVEVGPSYKYIDLGMMYGFGLTFVHPPVFWFTSLGVYR